MRNAAGDQGMNTMVSAIKAEAISQASAIAKPPKTSQRIFRIRVKGAISVVVPPKWVCATT